MKGLKKNQSRAIKVYDYMTLEDAKKLYQKGFGKGVGCVLTHIRKCGIVLTEEQMSELQEHIKTNLANRIYVHVRDTRPILAAE